MAEATGGRVSQSSDVTTGELLSRLTEQTSRLVRTELQMAQTELTAKAKRAGVGAGMFGAAGLLALYGGGALVATAILALALVLSASLAALLVGTALLAVAGVVALVGKRRVSRIGPALPQQTLDNVKRDVATLKGGTGHEQ